MAFLAKRVLSQRVNVINNQIDLFVCQNHVAPERWHDRIGIASRGIPYLLAQ